MSSASADRNLLFGVLAVQLDFVSRDQLLAAATRWAQDKDRPLAEVFVEQGALSRKDVELVEGVVQRHLERNNQDPRQSLESIEAFEAIRSTLGELPELGFRTTVEFQTLAAGSPRDPYSTQGAAQTQATDQGGRFKVLRLYQKGGLGRVSIALDEELHREIALKEILPAHADSEENRSRFVREAEITGALEHPGVVPVYSLGQFGDGRPFYAMRFIRGSNLQVAIEDYHEHADDSEESQLKFRSLVATIIHVCQAIEYAHSRGVLHRDLKPGNIMLGDYGETLVVDWGLAKTREDGFTDSSLAPPVQPSKRGSSTTTQVGRVVGTPAYMSPEQAAGRLDALGPTSDVYSLGATLYHLITGQVPFSGSEEEVLGNVQMGRFPRPRAVNRRVPRPLEAICLKAMARLPEDRYQSSREMAEDLERFMGDERVRAYAEPLPARAWRWVRNHKALVLSSAAALAVAVTALLVSTVLLSAAYEAERMERDRAERSFAEATKQRELAELNFKLARDAVRDYFITVSEERLLTQPGMQPLRDELLNSALAYYESFLQQRQSDPSLRGEVAEAQFLVGRISQLIGSLDNALTHYRAAAELQKQLSADEPENGELTSDYGATLNAIGDVELRQKRFAEAIESFQQAADIRGKLAEADPNDVEAARTYANSVMNIGAVYTQQGDFEKATPLLERAQMIRTAHVERYDTADPKLRRDLGMGYYNLALLRLQTSDVTLAENNFLKAVEIFQSLHNSQPDDMTFQQYLAASLRMLGDLKVNQRQNEESVSYYRQSQELLQKLYRENPDVLDYAADLAGVYLNLGIQLQALNQQEQALASLEDSARLLDELARQRQSVHRHRADLGLAQREAGKILAAMGRTAEARTRLEASQETLSRLVNEDPANEQYTAELGLTMDAQAALEAAPAPTPAE